MKRIVKNTALIALSSTLASGCASIVSDSNYLVRIDSTPPEARFVVRNEDGLNVHQGRTPATVSLPAEAGFFDGETYEVTFEKEGYTPVNRTLDSSVDPWYAGNILFGGLIGILVVDPATGAMFKLPESLQVGMGEPESEALAAISEEAAQQ